MKKIIVTEKERNSIRGMYLLEQETTGTTQTINQMLQGKEFPGLTKQEQDGTVYYSLIDPVTKRKRLWFISFRINSNNYIETSVTASDPKYFKMVEDMYNSLKGFKDFGYNPGFDKGDPEIAYGNKQTKVDQKELNEIFDTLVTSYNSSVPKQ